MNKKSVEFLVLFFFFISGFCGLVYEVVWMRLLGFILGNSIYSMATVVATFMAGLALGSYYGGRYADRLKNPLKSYGLLQGGIGLYCLLIPLAINWSGTLYKPFYRNWGEVIFVITSLRFLFGFLLLIIPTALMGATLPVLSRYFVSRLDVLGRSVGKIYAVNTFGAVFGAALSGYLLLPYLGTKYTIFLTVTLNLLIAVILLFFVSPSRQKGSGARNGVPASESEREEARPVAEEAGKTSTSVPGKTILFGYLLSGIAAMVYQIAWTRIIILIIGCSVYAFSLILTAYITGLALGAILIAPLVDRGKHLLRWFALMECGIGLVALAILPLFGKLPLFFANVLKTTSNSFLLLQLAGFGTVFVMILLPTLLLGAVFPLVTRLFTRELKGVGSSIGKVYASNTVGAIIGSVCGGFFLLPSLGIQNTLLVASAINFIVAIVLFRMDGTLSPFRRILLTVGLVAVFVVVGVSIPTWDQGLITSGVYMYIPQFAKGSKSDLSGADLVEIITRDSEILFHKEGVTTTVTVKRNTRSGDLHLTVDGKIDASTGRDMITQELCTHIPLMMHPNAENVLIIGLASGVSVGSAETYPVKLIDCLEISPAMVEASHYFDEVNHNALADDRCRLIIEDGRNHITLTDTMYDVIISVPSNPWISGAATLFTREFFERCRERMNPGGMMCQWLQSYSLMPKDFKAMVRTFREIFPHTSMWEPIIGGDYLLLGSQDREDLDWETLEKAFGYPEVRADLERVHVHSIHDFLSYFVMGSEEVKEFSGSGRLHTDDNLFLEYSAARSMYRTTVLSQLENLHMYRVSPGEYIIGIPLEVSEKVEANSRARKLLARAKMEEAKGSVEKATESLEEAFVTAPDCPEIRDALVVMLLKWGEGYMQTKDHEGAAAAFRKVVEVDPKNHAAWYSLALSKKGLNETRDALTAAARASALERDNPRYLVLQSSILLDLGETKKGESVYRSALEHIREEEHLLFSFADLEMKLNEMTRARKRLWQVLSLNPESAEARYNLANIFAGEGKPDSALLLYRKAISARPDFAPAYYNEANLLVEKGLLRAAVKSYRNAILYDPNFTRAHFNLANTFFRMKNMNEAVHHYREVLRLDPGNEGASHWLSLAEESIE